MPFVCERTRVVTAGIVSARRGNVSLTWRAAYECSLNLRALSLSLFQRGRFKVYRQKRVGRSVGSLKVVISIS